MPFSASPSFAVKFAMLRPILALNWPNEAVVVKATKVKIINNFFILFLLVI